MLTKEKDLERAFTKLIEQLGGLCLKWTSSTIGVPDRIVLMPYGYVFFVEFKSFGQKLRPIQSKRCADISSLGFYVFVVDCEQSMRDAIHEITFISRIRS